MRGLFLLHISCQYLFPASYFHILFSSNFSIFPLHPPSELLRELLHSPASSLSPPAAFPPSPSLRARLSKSADLPLLFYAPPYLRKYRGIRREQDGRRLGCCSFMASSRPRFFKKSARSLSIRPASVSWCDALLLFLWSVPYPFSNKYKHAALRVQMMSFISGGKNTISLIFLLSYFGGCCFVFPHGKLKSTCVLFAPSKSGGIFPPKAAENYLCHPYIYRFVNERFPPKT